MQAKYAKGNSMTFPLEFTEVLWKEQFDDDRYLLPKEAAVMYKQVAELCDQMEYDGSMMYDCCPDKICVEKMTKKLCKERCDDSMYRVLMQVLLCKEMGCRRERRRKHKEHLQKNSC